MNTATLSSTHIYAPALFVMNLNSMPEEVQTLVQEAAREASTYAREQNAEMEAAGMEINDSPDIEAFQTAVAPVYEKYGQQFGDYLPRIQEALQ